MGAKCTLTGKPTKILAGLDGVVIRHINSLVTGGRTLDVTDFSDDVIKAGHIVVKKLDEDETNYTYKPLGVEDGAYVALAEGEEYAGVVVASKPTSEAMVSILDDGRVNDVAMPYPLTDELRAALKTALPNLIFEHD